MFHSAEWDHDLDLTGRRVAVVGTGASAIQFVPEIAEVAASTTIYQRSAPWILPKTDRSYPEWERRLFRRFPLRVAASRLGLFAFFETGTYGFTGHRSVLAPFRKLADWERHRRLGDDPELLAKATPDYEIGCKRVLFTSDWYPTLRRDDVELVTAGIERVGAELDPRRRRRRARGRRDHLRHRLPEPQLRRPDGRPRARRARAERVLGRAPRGLPRDDGLRVPEHVRPLRAEHQPRLGLGPVHARVAVQLHRRRGRRACATATGAGSICGPRPRRRGGTRSPSAASTPSGRPVAARAGT